MKGICYLHAMGICYADLQHGPGVVVDSATRAIVLAADSDLTVDAAVGLARRVTRVGASAYAIGGGGPALALSSWNRAALGMPG